LDTACPRPLAPSVRWSIRRNIGDRSTLAIIFALRCQGHTVYVPFGENTRVDLIVEYGSVLRRVQCKTGRLRDGAVRFATCSTYAHHPNPKIRRRQYNGEIDDFAVYCPELGAVYLVPIEDVDVRSGGTLRVDAPRNNQSKGIRFAAPYEIAKIDVY
jgi:hypothetical protein